MKKSLTIIIFAGLASVVAGVISIILWSFIFGMVAQKTDLDSIFYTALVLVVRWWVTLLVGGATFSGLVLYFGVKLPISRRFFGLSTLNVLIMVALRESETAFRYGFFSFEYLEDIFRNTLLFIPYIFLIPFIYYWWSKKAFRPRVFPL